MLPLTKLKNYISFHESKIYDVKKIDECYYQLNTIRVGLSVDNHRYRCIIMTRFSGIQNKRIPIDIWIHNDWTTIYAKNLTVFGRIKDNKLCITNYEYTHNNSISIISNTQLKPMVKYKKCKLFNGGIGLHTMICYKNRIKEIIYNLITDADAVPYVKMVYDRGLVLIKIKIGYTNGSETYYRTYRKI
jgi:hypothetical protein